MGPVVKPPEEDLMAAATKLSKEERSLRAKLAAHSAHAKHGSRAMTAKARKVANFDRFADGIDPDRKLPPAELEARVASARQAHMAALSFRASRARAAKTSQK